MLTGDEFEGILLLFMSVSELNTLCQVFLCRPHALLRSAIELLMVPKQRGVKSSNPHIQSL